MSTLTWRFIAEKDIASRAIAWFGGGSWSHIDVRNPDGTYTGAREDGGYITPVECVGDYATYVSRIREDPTVEVVAVNTAGNMAVT